VRSRAATILDWLALTLLLAAIVIALSGGFSFRIGGDRITARSPERPLAAALIAIAVRWALDRRTWPLSRTLPLVRRLRDRVYRPELDRIDSAAAATTWRSHAIAIAGFVGFAAVLLLPQLRQMYSVPDLGDPLFSIWRFGWVFHKLGGDPRPLFSPNIFHPFPLTLTYSDSMLLPAVTTMPFLLLGVHPVVTYNLVLVLSFIASAVAMYALAWHLTRSRAAAFVAGLLFGFYPYRFEHYSHFELQMTYCMPLALLALHRFFATGQLRYALAFGALTAAQLYSSMYYAVFFTLYVGVLIAGLLLLTRPPLKRLVIPGALGAALALVLALPLARTYTSAQLGDRDPDTVAYYSATAADYLRAHPRSAAWGTRSLPGRMPERALFPGVMILLLATVALLPPIGTTRAVYFLGLVAAFELSRGFNSAVYPFLYDWLSFVRGLRVPARASILVALTLALLAAFGVRRLMAGRSSTVQRLLLATIVLAVGIDLRPLLKLEPVWREPPPVYEAIAGNPNVVLAEFPFGGSPRRYTPNAPFLYFSLWHWAQMLNGYSGHYPPGQVDFEVAVGTFPDEHAIELLRGRGATHVTITCALYGGACDELVARADAVPAFRIVASGRWQGAPVRLYEIKR
jgi:hypothetical protein